MKIKPAHIIVLILVIISAILAYDALTSYVNPYLTVSQVAGNDNYINKEVQILATAANWSTDKEGSLLINLTDGDATIEVRYSGVTPQSLKEGQKVVTIGELTAPYHLDATQLLVKCPSKYE